MSLMRMRLCVFLPVSAFMATAFWSIIGPEVGFGMAVYELASWVVIVEVPAARRGW